MSKNDDGGPAFPLINELVGGSNDYYRGGVVPQNETRRYVFSGMTLRDWFAGQALAGTLTIYGPMPAEDWASQAYEIADAMLVMRKKEPRT